MASNALKLHMLPFKTLNHPSGSAPHRRPLFPSLPFPRNQPHHGSPGVSIYLSYHRKQHRMAALSIFCSLSSSNPPTTKEEAIKQAKTCLSTALEKPLNNPKLSGKLKKLKQPRFQVEIPVMDDSPNSLSLLVLDVFKDISIKSKGSRVKTLILWPSTALESSGSEAFLSHSSSSNIEHGAIGTVTNGDNRILTSADVAVFIAPERSQLPVMKAICDNFYPKPVVIFNPSWGFEEESDFGELSGFVGSFEVVYSFMGLEVQGVLSKRKGVVFKCVRDGVVSGEKWSVLVEEEGGELKVVSRFKTRPSIGEVENVLYNLMAMNSPITKSAKFLRELVSNVTGRK